jgi:hypothetical protein
MRGLRPGTPSKNKIGLPQSSLAGSLQIGRKGPHHHATRPILLRIITTRNIILEQFRDPAQICPLFQIAGWSSLVARKAHNLEVARSNRAPATNLVLLDRRGPMCPIRCAQRARFLKIRSL